ncbi:carbohydrate ABC transporter permease [Treponema primitia]|uniref:carbohydrate ABC transporter permease n=1 Tax=Treponema primitia TaxID=88058 RepID=UPI0002554EBF|nr:sugar ABC transporter permease [Treponema primitia]
MKSKIYNPWFLAPLVLVYAALFLIPMIISFFFSMTIWTLTEFRFVGLYNFKTFFSEYSLRIGVKNTLLYAALTCGFKAIFGLALAVLLTSPMKTKNLIRSILFFPNLVSTIAVGMIFSSMMHPSRGLFNSLLGALGIAGPDWLGNASLALFSVIAVDVWKGVGVATVIYVAGLMAIPETYYEAASIDGAGGFQRFRMITLPLVQSSINTVIVLAFIGGIRTFDLIWTMTKGGPGFATDTMASIIYKQYAYGFYGLSTAGNVIMFLLIAAIVFPLYRFLISLEVDV